jgi:hypothetical protein
VRKYLAAVLLTAAVFGLGCGGVTTTVAKKSTKIVHITWTDDGNPKVSVCSTALVSCKTNLIVIDLNTGLRTPLPLSVNSFDVPNSTDTYEVHVVGYDKDGHSIESVCCTVVKR